MSEVGLVFIFAAIAYILYATFWLVRRVFVPYIARQIKRWRRRA